MNGGLGALEKMETEELGRVELMLQEEMSFRNERKEVLSTHKAVMPLEARVTTSLLPDLNGF